MTYTVCIYLFHCKTFGLQHCYYNAIITAPKVSKGFPMFHSRWISWYQHQMLMKVIHYSKVVNSVLSNYFQRITEANVFVIILSCDHLCDYAVVFA